MKKILFISNGHGEDLVAAEIIKKLQADISVFPLVGEGKAYDDLNVKILGARQKLPSGGFSLRNIWFLCKDIVAGLIGSTLRNIKVLRSLKGQFDLVVAIGDIVPIIGALATKCPFIFVGVNKSSYYKWFGFNYTPWEKQLLQSYANKVFVRDKVTEHDLQTRGIKVKSAEYVGNPLMDCVASDQLQVPSKQTETHNQKLATIGLLPGTRDDAKLNMEDFAEIAREVIKMKPEDQEIHFITATTLENIPTYIEKKSFSEVLSQADLIIGLSGTGNEQAAGYGIPIISFYGRGSQYNKKFAKAQQQLLGEALYLVADRQPLCVAAAVWEILHNPKRMEQMAQVGQEHMGRGGAIEKISQFIAEGLR